MEQHTPLNQLRVNDEVQGFYLLKSAYAKTNKNGKPFLSAVLEDASGSMDAKLWEYDNSTVGEQDAGRIVYVTGTITEFMGALQLRINALRLRRPEETVDLTALTPSAPIDADAVLARVWQLVESMEDDDYRAIEERFAAALGLAEHQRNLREPRRNRRLLRSAGEICS